MPVQEFIDKRRDPLPKVEKYKREWDPEGHKIFNTAIYPNRRVVNDIPDGQGGTKEDHKDIDIVRIGLPLQKTIVRTGAAFFCGIPVSYANNDDESEGMYQAFQELIKKAKIRFIDREIYVTTGRFTESAEFWFWNTKPNDYYGFDSDFEIGVQVLSPEDYNFYPEFDQRGKMVRFSREWVSDETEFFETYTAEEIIKYRKNPGEEWEEVDKVINPIGKIPFVYYRQQNVDWYDVQGMIERLEEIYSNIGESNDRFAFPLLKLKGVVTGQITQERSGRVLQLEGDGADASFAEQPNAAANLMLEINRLERDIYDLTNTPNLSPESLKGLGNLLSGIAMRYFFMSAHLKVMEKQSIYEPAFLRRVSIVNSIFKQINPRFRNQDLDLDPIITPYVINSREALAEFVMSVNGGQPIWSQRRSMEEFGVTDPESMIQEIQDETNRRADYENASEFFGL